MNFYPRPSRTHLLCGLLISLLVLSALAEQMDERDLRLSARLGVEVRLLEHNGVSFACPSESRPAAEIVSMKGASLIVCAARGGEFTTVLFSEESTKFTSEQALAEFDQNYRSRPELESAERITLKPGYGVQQCIQYRFDRFEHAFNPDGGAYSLWECPVTTRGRDLLISAGTAAERLPESLIILMDTITIKELDGLEWIRSGIEAAAD